MTKTILAAIALTILSTGCVTKQALFLEEHEKYASYRKGMNCQDVKWHLSTNKLAQERIAGLSGRDLVDPMAVFLDFGMSNHGQKHQSLNELKLNQTSLEQGYKELGCKG